MPSGQLFGSQLETLKLLTKCLLAAIGLIVVIGGAIYLLVHVGHIGIAE